METKKMIMILGAGIGILAVLYFVLPIFILAPGPANYTLKALDIEVSNLTNVSIGTVYWGEKDSVIEPELLCSNETKNNISSFVVEANTELKAVSYEKCYIKNNGEKVSTEIVEMHDNLAAMTASAEVDRENKVQACCVFKGKTSCSDVQPLYRCPLK